MAHTIKHDLPRLSQRYATALRKHLSQGPAGSLESARGLGCHAVSLGLETLDVARMHEEALMALTAANGKAGAMKRAEVFFKEAIAPIEDTHHAAREANADLNQANKTLDRRTVDLADSKASLKKGITRRKTLERLLRKSGKHSQKLLKESRHLQKHLQHLTHQVLFAHEDKRKKISTDLRDEIGQTLLGINVRLLTLKQAAMVDTASLKQDIVSTQRLVDRSVKIINRFAREFGKRHES